MIDEEIRLALKVDPSPEFLVRVRSRIASEPAPAAWRWSWALVAAGAIAAGIVVSIIVSRPSHTETPRPDVVKSFTPEDTTAAKAPGSASNSVSSPLRGREPHVLQRSQAEAQGANARRGQAETQSAKAGDAVAISVVSGVRRTVGPDSDVLLDPRETRALRQLISGVREGRIDLTAARQATSPSPSDPEPVGDIVIAPITIDPIAPFSGAEGVRP